MEIFETVGYVVAGVIMGLVGAFAYLVYLFWSSISSAKRDRKQYMARVRDRSN